MITEKSEDEEASFNFDGFYELYDALGNFFTNMLKDQPEDSNRRESEPLRAEPASREMTSFSLGENQGRSFTDYGTL